MKKLLLMSVVLTGFRGQEILVNNIKNSRLIIYGNTGHALHWEEPKKFAEDLVNFIDNVIRFK